MDHQPPAIQSAPPPPPAAPSSDEQLWIVFSHISILLGIGILLPLIVYLVKKDESPRIAEHAKEALNFHISILIYSLACAITCIGIPLAVVIGIGAMVYAIIAAVKASDPVPYRYPLTMRLVT